MKYTIEHIVAFHLGILKKNDFSGNGGGGGFGGGAMLEEGG